MTFLLSQFEINFALRKNGKSKDITLANDPTNQLIRQCPHHLKKQNLTFLGQLLVVL